MTESLDTTRKVRAYDGFDLAIGSVLAVRRFRADDLGRLWSLNDQYIWTPGENVAECKRDELGGLTFSFLGRRPSTLFTHSIFGDPDPAPDKPSKADEATEARITHDAPMPSCGCGFYAYARGCDNGEYDGKKNVTGVVECYGRTILGTRGLRAEKARIVALHKPSRLTRDLYPEVKAYRSLRWLLRRHDVIEPYKRTPETDPNFWSAKP